MRRFSIVVSTCDRPNLLAPGVRAVLETHFDDFELIVSDNFCKQPAAEILSGFSDKRLSVIRTDRRLPIADHWEFIWDYVGGEFVMYLGDDNALHPDILKFADAAIRDHDLDVLSWRPCIYFHPDWNVTYDPWPNRGNILGIGAGTTQQLYQCDPAAVLRSFCQTLRLYGCFPCLLNFLFRKADADKVRKRAGRFFWAPNPDITMSYLTLGTIRPGAYAFYDAFGGITGRSRDCNLAAHLSHGKANQKIQEFIAEHHGQDLFPHHEPKFDGMTNSLAATISQAKTVMPEYFGAYDFDPKTLALRTIDDLYVDRTMPWDDNPAFFCEFDVFVKSLPPPDAAEVFAYREQCVQRLREKEKQEPPPCIRNSDDARVRLVDFLRNTDAASKQSTWRLFRETWRNPLGRHWVSGDTTYVDMRLFGGRDIADAARNLPRVLAHFDKRGNEFAKFHKDAGMLGEVVPLEAAATASRALAAE